MVKPGCFDTAMAQLGHAARARPRSPVEASTSAEQRCPALGAPGSRGPLPSRATPVQRLPPLQIPWGSGDLTCSRFTSATVSGARPLPSRTSGQSSPSLLLESLPQSRLCSGRGWLPGSRAWWPSSFPTAARTQLGVHQELLLLLLSLLLLVLFQSGCSDFLALHTASPQPLGKSVWFQGTGTSGRPPHTSPSAWTPPGIFRKEASTQESVC